MGDETPKPKVDSARKIVPIYNGSGDALVWLDRLKVMCEINNVVSDNDILNVLVSRLDGRAYIVFTQLTRKRRAILANVEKALMGGFGIDQWQAHQRFEARVLRPGEGVDAFLADLRSLAGLVGGVSNRWLVCKFLRGLPESVAGPLRLEANGRIGLEEAQIQARTAIRQIEEKARNGLALKQEEGSLCAAVASGGSRPGPNKGAVGGQSRVDKKTLKCYQCNQVGHVRAKCPDTKTLKCYQCNQVGHVRAKCPDTECFKCRKKGHVATYCPENE